MAIRLTQRTQVALVVLLAVVTVVLVGVAVHTGGTSRPSAEHATRPAAPRPSSSVAPAVPTMLVLGDSAAAGAGASARRTAWVSRVARGTGWRVLNRSVVGSGYLSRSAGVGSCQRATCPSFATALRRVKADPDVVLVAGGRDDALSGAALAQPARRLFAALRTSFPDATLVALDPGYDNLNTEDATASADVRSAVRRAQGRFLDVGQPLVAHPGLVSSDGSSPDDAGHRAIARAVLSRLRQLSVG
jgi:lysophospholipase L1-like esterase